MYAAGSVICRYTVLATQQAPSLAKPHSIVDLKSIAAGRIIGGSVETAITTLHPIEGHYEQSGDEIWQKSGECVREAIKRAQVKPEDIAVC